MQFIIFLCFLFVWLTISAPPDKKIQWAVNLEFITPPQTCIGGSSRILRKLFLHGPSRVVLMRKTLDESGCYGRPNFAILLQNRCLKKSSWFLEKLVPTNCSLAYRKGFAVADALTFRQCAAFFWKPAPGNQLGIYFKMGSTSTQKVPGVVALTNPSKASSASDT